MESVEDVIVVGAGIAGLALALGLHREGLRSIVLESSDTLRVTGFALSTWMNAWKAMDALGIGHSLRQEHMQIERVVSVSALTGLATANMSFMGHGNHGKHELRGLRRKMLLEAVEKELPKGTIRFGSKVVSIEKEEDLKLVHLADGEVLKTKVLVGCDGVNSVVAKWLGLWKPTFSGRNAIRGFAEFPEGHGFKPEFLQLMGDGFRSGFIPCNDKIIYWFFTYSASLFQGEQDDHVKLKQFVLSKLQKVPKEVIIVVEKTDLDAFTCSPLKFRLPWNVLFGDICKDNVCVAGDALHPMTPDIGQGGCSALEDAVTLARCLGESLLGGPNKGGGDERERIKKGLEKYAKERRWRGFELIATSYVVGFVQQSNGRVLNFLRDNVLSKFFAGTLLKKADFDCGKLYTA